MKVWPLAGLALLMWSGGVFAAPGHLMNKTVLISYTLSIPARKEDGSTLVATRTTSRTVYISTQGRVFVRVASRARGGSADRDVGPEQGSGSLRLEGDRLVGVISRISGANLLTVTFDSSGSSCNASLIVGAEGGKPIVWKGLNGSVMTATAKPSVSGLSCSISPGNALAG